MISIIRPACPDLVKLASNYKYHLNKQALIDASWGKCMYCESKVSHVYFGDIEHIKPKAQDKYPHLEFEWSNLGFCCAVCNNSKSDRYDEECPPIDPYAEDPGDHLFPFGTLLRHKAGSERGQTTVTLASLNRAELIEQRALRLEQVQSAIDACYRTKSVTLRELLLEALSPRAVQTKSSQCLYLR